MNHPDFIKMKEEHDNVLDELRTQKMNLESVNNELNKSKKKELIMLKEVMDN
jgi:hypothetical protein